MYVVWRCHLKTSSSDAAKDAAVASKESWCIAANVPHTVHSASDAAARFPQCVCRDWRTSMARRRSPAAWSDRAVHSATAWAVARFAAGVSSVAVALASFREQARTRST